MLEFPGEGVNLQKSPVFCKNLHFGLSLSPYNLSAPRVEIATEIAVIRIAAISNRWLVGFKIASDLDI